MIWTQDDEAFIICDRACGADVFDTERFQLAVGVIYCRRSAMPTASYWAVPCQTCGPMISSVLIEFDSKKELIQPSLIDALEVGRLLCRNVKAYAPHALIAWEGALPATDVPATSGLSIDCRLSSHS